MALEQRNTSRVLARVGTWCKAAVFHVADVIESLLNFREEDELRVKGTKTFGFIVRRGIYLTVDYWLSGLSILLAVSMKTLGFSLFEMCMGLWAFDFAAAGLFVAIYEVTGKDLSLGEDMRRAVDTIIEKSWVLGFFSVLGIFLLAIVWTGPEKIITFFREEIATTRRVVLWLILLTEVQAFIWAALYSFAYDFAMKLMS